MKKYVLFFVLFATSVNAATMCVPDLTACVSCTPVSYSGMVWRANCCGVDVSGIVLPYVGFGGVVVSTLYDLNDWSGEQWDSLRISYTDTTRVLCVMTEPFFVSNAFFSYCMSGSDFRSNAAKICAEKFQPTCVFSDCRVPVCNFGGGSSE